MYLTTAGGRGRPLSRRAFLAVMAATASAALASCCAPSAFGYGFYQYGNGRADQAARYDLAGSLFPAQMGNPAIYDFGNIAGFAALPPGLTNPIVTTAATNAGNAWEPWANISVGNALAAANTGLVRLRYDDTKASGAGTLGYGSGGNTFAQITFGREASGGVAWNSNNFEWVLTHELGHVLGLDDLYFPYTEEFVDHPVPGNPNPFWNGNLAQGDGRRDNIMDRYRYDSNNYALTPQTVIDNDEVAGVTWIWNGPYNQIVTGDLATAWNADTGRNTEEHHGDQNNPPGWWDYRGTIVSGGAGPSFVDVYFPGYETFLVNSYSSIATTWQYMGEVRGPDIRRFQTTANGWSGNFELFVKSAFTDEQRVSAWVSGSREDQFILGPDQSGRVFANGNRWVQVFGPVSIPEPSTLLLAGLGLIGGVTAPRRKRG